MGIILGLMAICLLVYVAADASLKNDIEKRTRVCEGEEYLWELVGMDGSTKDYNKYLGGTMSLQEYKRRHNSGYYGIYAWVKKGTNKYDWDKYPINRDIFFRYASGFQTLPPYLFEEMKDSVYVKMKNTSRAYATVDDYKAWEKTRM